MTKKSFFMAAVFFFVIAASDVFAQFYTKKAVFEFDVDFGKPLGVLHYYGYRPSEDELIQAVHTNYFPYQLGPSEILMPPSYGHIENNTALDSRIRDFMKKNKLTVCKTAYPNEYGGYTYVVNYSFNNYKTFGTIMMDSTSQ